MPKLNLKLPFLGGMAFPAIGAVSESMVLISLASFAICLITVVGREGFNAQWNGHVDKANIPQDEIGEEVVVRIYRRFGAFIGGAVTGFLVIIFIKELGIT